MEHFRKTIKTEAGELYAYGSDTELNSYIEIGFYDETGNGVPIAAIEVKKEKLTRKKDNGIVRCIYNLDDPDDYVVDIVRK